MRRRILLAGLAIPAVARAQRRALRLIVPFPPGGAVDSLGRLLADGLAPVLGQAVVVENRAGAGGVVGADAVAKSAPDGGTIGILSAASLLAAPLLQAGFPFDVMRDLTPVTQISDSAVLCVANAAAARRAGWRGLDDMLAAARARPGAVRVGTTGVATVSHLALAAIGAGAGVEVLHVPYRGGAEALAAALSGEVDAVCDLPGPLVAHVAAGNLAALTVSSRRRMQSLPDVPGLGEAPALDRFDIRSWNMLMMARATPAEEVARIFTAARQVAAGEVFRAALRQVAYDAVTSDSPEAAARFLADEAPRWRELVRLSGASVHR